MIVGFGSSHKATPTQGHESRESDSALQNASDQSCFVETEGVIISTMADLPGHCITKVLGAVYGVTVRSHNVAAGWAMGLKDMAGGELNWFTSMLHSCRNDSITRVVQETRKRGGNAIISLRFDTGDLGGYAQACAYGTACVVEKIAGGHVEAPQLESS